MSDLQVQAFSREVRWVDGIPTLVDGPIITQEALKKLVPTVLSMEYEGREVTDEDGNTSRVVEPEFEGKPNAEVMLIRMARAAAQGNEAATTSFLDRMLGKPKQQTENLNVNMGYLEFIKTLEDSAGRENIHIANYESTDDL